MHSHSLLSLYLRTEHPVPGSSWSKGPGTVPVPTGVWSSGEPLSAPAYFASRMWCSALRGATHLIDGQLFLFLLLMVQR